MEMTLDMRISHLLLHEYEIKPNIRGYRYLREAIKLACENEKILNSMTKQLYPVIAEKYETGWRSAERAMRYAIERAWFENPFMAHKPTTGEFIAMAVEDLRFESQGIA